MFIVRRPFDAALVAAIFLQLVALVGNAGGGWVCTGLGDLPGGEFYSRATDVSKDGSTVVGFSSSGGRVDLTLRFAPSSARGRARATRSTRFHAPSHPLARHLGNAARYFPNPGQWQQPPGLS